MFAPTKRISEGQDMPKFFKSPAYFQLQQIITKLAHAVSLKRVPTGKNLDQLTPNPEIRHYVTVLDTIRNWADDIPLSDAPRRFGNVSFRIWHEKLHNDGPELLKSGMSAQFLEKKGHVEVLPYFFGSFGSDQRLDFGTGHELSFVAFVGCLLLTEEIKDPSGEDLLLLFDQYFKTVRKLIMTYTLEAAGSRGVWGLDDHFHVPYILGAAQIVDINAADAATPNLSPKTILDQERVRDEAPTNLYFGAIEFIYSMKRGNFWEHSPILYDVSAIPTWHKIYRGMVKMYVAEVLGKFPVVQHFLFGSLFAWESSEPTSKPAS